MGIIRINEDGARESKEERRREGRKRLLIKAAAIYILIKPSIALLA